ncbi:MULTISPECIES: response regulator transcription factor [Limnobacter]|jgi:DNA-binding NarL/FixJ family response regulator|uniref:response regulator transcription factor n=1 Tax=Limnobacter TaxID=131079 RepID=UPI001486A0A1|nr:MULTISPECIES: response regulator transcription factor [Limnobacter]
MSTPNQLRVFIIDDHPIIAMALRDIMNSRYTDLEVKLFSRIGPALEHSRFEQPDLVLLDLGLPDMAPEKVLETALETFDYSRTLVISGNEEILGDMADEYPETEFVSKGITQDRVLSVLDSMVLRLRRNNWTDQISQKTQHASGFTIGQRMARITERQVSVLYRIAKGESNHEIAQNLGLSPETVKTHVRSILARLNARNRLEAAMLYRAWQEQKTDEVYSD